MSKTQASLPYSSCSLLPAIKLLNISLSVNTHILAANGVLQVVRKTD